LQTEKGELKNKNNKNNNIKKINPPDKTQTKIIPKTKQNTNKQAKYKIQKN